MKSLTRTAYRAIAAFVTAAFVMIGLASPAFADGAPGTITNPRFPEKATPTLLPPPPRRKVATPLNSVRATTPSTA